jgi:RNA ligase
LIAVRNVATGEYTSYQELLELGHNHDIEVVRAYQGTVANMQHLMHETHDLKGQEGWVIRWNDGHMTKLKAAEYVTIHKAKDNILRERGVLELILDEKLDDVKPFLLVEDKLQLETYESSFWSGLKNTAYDWNETNQAFRNQYGDNRKAFAIEMAPQLESNLRSAIFTAWDKENYDFLMHLVGCVRKNIGTQTKINEVRHLWGGAQWNLGVSGDE